MKKSSVGFTLIEMLVVLAILSILSGLLYANFSDAKAQSRDAKRQADLRLVQSALELYKNDHGVYPSGCNATTTWSGQTGSPFPCTTTGRQYIVNLAPKYIPVLPVDPKLSGAPGSSGYMYTVSTDGMVYKLIALNTVESGPVDYDHPFARCGNSGSSGAECNAVPPASGGTYSYNSLGSEPAQCRSTEKDNDFAVFGGYANGTTEREREYYSDSIKCK